MSGHSRWWLDRQRTAAVEGDMIQYVQGYILAMNDVLSGLDVLRKEKSSDAEIIEALELCATSSLANAMRTLDVIVKKSTEALISKYLPEVQEK